VLPRFHRFAEGAVLIAHNAPFDMTFLRRREGELGLRFDNPILDTVLLSAVIWGQSDVHSLDALTHRLGITIPEEARHTAIGDTMATAEAFLKLVPMLQARGLTTFGDVLAEVRRHGRLLNGCEPDGLKGRHRAWAPPFCRGEGHGGVNPALRKHHSGPPDRIDSRERAGKTPCDPGRSAAVLCLIPLSENTLPGQAATRQIVPGNGTGFQRRGLQGCENPSVAGKGASSCRPLQTPTYRPRTGQRRRAAFRLDQIVLRQAALEPCAQMAALVEKGPALQIAGCVVIGETDAARFRLEPLTFPARTAGKRPDHPAPRQVLFGPIGLALHLEGQRLTCHPRLEGGTVQRFCRPERDGGKHQACGKAKAHGKAPVRGPGSACHSLGPTANHNRSEGGGAGGKRRSISRNHTGGTSAAEAITGRL